MFHNKARQPREATNKLLELVDEGLIDKDYVIRAFTSWLSEADVAQVCHDNEIWLFVEEDEEDDD